MDVRQGINHTRSLTRRWQVGGRVAAALIMCMPALATSCEPPPTGCSFAADSPTILVAFVTDDQSVQNAATLGWGAWNSARTNAPRFVPDGRFSGAEVDVVSSYDAQSGVRALTETCLGPNPQDFLQMDLNAFYMERESLASIKNTGAHELGHTLGLAEDPFETDALDRADCPKVSLMYFSHASWTVCSINSPTDYDVTAVNKIYT